MPPGHQHFHCLWVVGRGFLNHLDDASIARALERLPAVSGRAFG